MNVKLSGYLCVCVCVRAHARECQDVSFSVQSRVAQIMGDKILDCGVCEGVGE